MVKMSSIAAENYHLKWDSHLSYLNLSLNNLYKNEKYADVMLVTSNVDSGGPIPAHRFILSSCSQFFASIFEGIQTLANSVTYIVLPPELSRKAIQILVQYMYVGEATVSNDILTEVLRGGEILKVRGLCRNHNDRDQRLNESKISSHTVAQNVVSYPENIGHEANLRALSSSAMAIPKESPVIVMSPKVQPTQPPLAPTLLTPNITVNKEYAIDPDDSTKNNNFGMATSHLSRIAQKLSCSTLRTYPVFSHDSSFIREKERFRRHSEDALLSSRSSEMCRDEVLNMSQRMSPEPEAIERSLHRNNSLPEHRSHIVENEVFRRDHQMFSTNCPLDDSLGESLELLPIKEEPSEWPADHGSDCVTSSNKLTPLDMVKVETSMSDDEEKVEGESSGNPVYSPLTCELCSETFMQPADWVRHIESHMDIPAKYIPKKRKRVSISPTELTASLKCDLCNKQYETPADWVRHIQSTHTETELAICNNSGLPKPRRSGNDRLDMNDSNKCTNREHCNSPDYYRKVPPKKNKLLSEYAMLIGKTCDVCNKDFTSYANMIIHRKTHAAELYPK